MAAKQFNLITDVKTVEAEIEGVLQCDKCRDISSYLFEQHWKFHPDHEFNSCEICYVKKVNLGFMHLSVHKKVIQFAKSDQNETVKITVEDVVKFCRETELNKYENKKDSNMFGKSEEAEKDDKSEEAEKDDKSEEAEKDVKSEEAEKDDKSEDTEKDDKSEEAEEDDKSEEAEKDVKSEETEIDDKSEEAEKDDKSEELREDVKTENVENFIKTDFKIEKTLKNDFRKIYYKNQEVNEENVVKTEIVNTDLTDNVKEDFQTDNKCVKSDVSKTYISEETEIDVEKIYVKTDKMNKVHNNFPKTTDKINLVVQTEEFHTSFENVHNDVVKYERENRIIEDEEIRIQSEKGKETLEDVVEVAVKSDKVEESVPSPKEDRRKFFVKTEKFNAHKSDNIKKDNFDTTNNVKVLNIENVECENFDVISMTADEYYDLYIEPEIVKLLEEHGFDPLLNIYEEEDDIEYDDNLILQNQEVFLNQIGTEPVLIEFDHCSSLKEELQLANDNLVSHKHEQQYFKEKIICDQFENEIKIISILNINSALKNSKKPLKIVALRKRKRKVKLKIIVKLKIKVKWNKPKWNRMGMEKLRKKRKWKRKRKWKKKGKWKKKRKWKKRRKWKRKKKWKRKNKWKEERGKWKFWKITRADPILLFYPGRSLFILKLKIW